MKKKLNIFLSVFSFVLLVFFLINMFSFWSGRTSETMENSSELTPILGTEQCFFDNNYCYLINTMQNNIQIFDSNGQFLNKLIVPSKGGILWCGYNEALYVYSVRSKECIRIERDTYKIIKDTAYRSEKEFYTSIKANNEFICKLKGNEVVKNGEVQLRLNVETTALNFEISLFLSMICLFIFLYTSGLIEKWNTNRKNNDKDRDTTLLSLKR